MLMSLSHDTFVNVYIYSLCSYISAGNWSALLAYDSPDLAALWAALEIFLRDVDGQPLHIALNTNLNVNVNIHCVKFN